ncbi:ABC transporter permease [Singulisphaera rosea]
MFAGPVAHFELVRLARRGRFFSLRFGFGLILLAIVGINYWSLFGFVWFGNDLGTGEVSGRQLTWFARALFTSMTLAQAVLVLVLTPAVVADAIASERHRKTLHDLLTSRLSGGEIVLGKLTARLLHIATFLAEVLPIFSLLTLLGGVDPEGLVWSIAIVGASALFLAGLSILASVELRRPREAIVLAYSSAAVWLILPALLSNGFGALRGGDLLGPLSPRTLLVLDWIERGVEWAWPPNPFLILGDFDFIGSGDLAGLRSRAVWAIVRWLVYGSLGIALAAGRLRIASRRNEGTGVRRALSRKEYRSAFSRRACGDDPVYWKEAFFSRRPRGWLRRLARFGMLLILAGVLVWALLNSIEAFQEVLRSGYGFVDRSSYQGRYSFNFVIRYGVTLLFVCWMIRLGTALASGIPSEHEQDTWVGLLATPLDGAEIVKGKMLGPLRASAAFGGAIVALGLLGAASGAVHPLGVVAALVCVVLFTWYVMSLGITIAMRSKTVWRAQAAVLGILIVPHACCLVPSPFVFLAASLFSYDEVDGQLLRMLVNDDGSLTLMFAYIACALAGFTALSTVMTRRAFRNFDRVAGRPFRKIQPIIDLGLLEVGQKNPSNRPRS